LDSVVPETALLQVLDAKAVEDAKHTVETMLVAGSNSSACEDLADAIISEADSAVSQEQEILKVLSDGSECSTEGQAILDAAQTHLTAAQEKKTSADTAAATAASAPVDFGEMSLSSLGNSQCVNLQNNPNVIAAKKASDDANAAAIAADAELTAAQNSLVDAQAAQKAANKPCQCTAYQNYEIAYEKAKTASEEHLVAWKKGKHMHCVLAGTDPSSCSMDGAPEVTKRTLAEGVDQSACTSAPTPSPTRSPTPPPTKGTCAGLGGALGGNQERCCLSYGYGGNGYVDGGCAHEIFAEHGAQEERRECRNGRYRCRTATATHTGCYWTGGYCAPNRL